MEGFDLKKFREKEAKLSQRELAAALGVTQGTIGKLEAAGGTIRVSNKLLDRIAEKFGVDTEPYKTYNQGNELPHEESRIEIGEYEFKYYKLLEEKDALLNRFLQLSDENRDLHKKLVACTEERKELLMEIEQLQKKLTKNSK